MIVKIFSRDVIVVTDEGDCKYNVGGHRCDR